MFSTTRYKNVLIQIKTDCNSKIFTTPIERIGATFKSMHACKMAITARLALGVIAHRPPTAQDCKAGYGETHYRNFELREFWDFKEQRLKTKIKADDGLIYSRR